jgi:hypothetical protein
VVQLLPPPLFKGISPIVKLKFENYYISNNRTPTTNYRSIHFIIDGKELTNYYYGINDRQPTNPLTDAANDLMTVVTR